MHGANRMSLGYLAAKNALYTPHKDFLIEGERRINFQAFHQQSDALASGLLARGLEPGGRVAVINHNSVELLLAYFGAMKAGGVAAPVSARLSPPEITAILQDAEPSFVLVGRDYLDKLEPPVLQALPGRVYVIGGGGGLPSLDELTAAGGTPPEPGGGMDGLAMLIYTSGTTGRPKGVMLSHGNLWSDSFATALSRGLSPDDIALVSAPLYQAGALGSVLGNVLRGNSIVLLDGFDPEKVLQAIQRERVTTALLVPTMLLRLLEHPALESYDLGSVKSIVYGAAPMPVPVLKRALDRFGWSFAGACGATETGPAYIAFLGPEDHKFGGGSSVERRLRSIGKEGINAQVRIFDPQDRPLPPGEVGEIVVRGPHIMMGYWRNPAETEKALRNGWYHTGDLGFIDDDGYIFIVDRQKDMIISGGFNVYPREIENALAGHPDVLETAVVGRRDPVWGETPVAFLVPRAGAAPPGDDEIMEFLRRKLASYKLPRGGLLWVDELPRNPSGKVLKRSLRDKLKEQGA